MSTLAPNIPLVIQQAGDVSRIQDVTQRTGELQQSAAAAEVQRERQAAARQVQGSPAAQTQNRLRPRQRGENSPDGEGPSGRRRQTSDAQAEPGLDPEREGGGVVDVVV